MDSQWQFFTADISANLFIIFLQLFLIFERLVRMFLKYRLAMRDKRTSLLNDDSSIKNSPGSV